VGYLKAAVAVVLAGMLAGPAVAGVTGAEGGSKTITTSVKKVYDRGSQTTNKNVQTSSRSDVNGGTTVHIKYWVGGRGDGKGLGSLEGALWNWVRGGADPGQGWTDYVETAVQSGLTNGQIQGIVRDSVNTNNRGLIFDRVSPTTSSSSSKSSSQTGPVYVGSTFMDRTSTQTNNLLSQIVVGDLDFLAGAWVAQGNVTQHTEVTDHHRKDYVNTTTTNTHTTTYYQSNVRAAVSPIVLDLDRDGKLQASGGKWLAHSDTFDKTRVALFDFHANGFPVLTEWVGPQDGLLVRPHADGRVDGSCLFGTFGGYANGYEALRTLDVDGNGQVEGAELQGLKVWQDGNSDAIVNDGELLTLDELGITSLGVQHDQMRGTFVRDGQTCQSFDWWPSVVEMRKKDMSKQA